MLPATILSPEVLPAAARWLDLAGLAVFAASGALAAAKRGQTIVTAVFFGLITGVGGGTVRDLLIDAPVFWVHDARAASMCLIVALVIWLTPERWWRDEALGWFDAVGLAAYAVYGAAKALGYGVPPVPAALMGVMTACVGGIIRDVLAGEPSILMRPELYVTAAALASASYVGLVDRFGTLKDAIDEAAKRAKLNPASVHAEYLEKPPGFLAKLAADFDGGDDEDTTGTDAFGRIALERRQMVARALGDMQRLTTAGSIQARCLECGGIGPSVGDVGDARLLDLLLARIGF